MKASEYLRLAAEQSTQWEFVDGVGAYYLLAYCTGKDMRYSPVHELAKSYFALFRPIKENKFSPWWWDFGAQPERTLALLFAAAIAESEGK